MLSVQEFAEKKGISYQRALDLVHQGTIKHSMVGKIIAIAPDQLDWQPLSARPLSKKMANALLSHLSGAEVSDLSPTERSRMRKHLAQVHASPEPARILHEKTLARAEVRTFNANKAILEMLYQDRRLVLTGVCFPGSQLTSDNVFEAYCNPSDLEQIKRDHWLVEGANGNASLYLSDVPEKHTAWAIADLGRWNCPRELREAKRLLSALLGEA